MTTGTTEKRRVFFDMDGCLCEFKKVPTLEMLYEKGYFLNLAPHSNVLGALEQMRADPNLEVYILSAYLSDSRYALSEKEEWLDRYLPELDCYHRVFTPCGTAKSDAVPGGIRPTDILVDDYSVNLHEWNEAGGISVKLKNGINGTKGTWKGTTVCMYDLPENIVKLVQKVF